MNRRGSERGAALLVAMVSIAVLTALAVNLAYESRVSLQIAANARDELRASYAARGGVALSRLVLSFQQRLDLPPQAAALPIPRVQIWRMVPVGSALAGTLFPGAAPAEGNGGATGPAARFDAVIDDEGRKVNAQLEALEKTSKILGPQVQGLYQLVCEPRWDPLFDREDARGVRISREDLLVHLRDWVDIDERPSALSLASSAATGCGTVVGQPPFEEGFGDENQPYDRGDDRYRAKNARMDSLDELHLVAGVSDAFMAAFGDALTVYLPRDAKQNINTIDRDELLRFAKFIAAPRTQPAIFDPIFAERLQKLVLERTVGGLLSLTPAAFGELVEAAGVLVDKALLAATNTNSPFTDRSSTFRIRASGVAGDVTSVIDAVVRLEDAQPGATAAAAGRIIHWREE
jgi:general secretion pathway protein K